MKNKWNNVSCDLHSPYEIYELENEISQVTNWILGPGNNMTNTHYEVAFDITSSEYLRREHEELELECRETFGAYANLLHRVNTIANCCLTDDLESQIDFMNFVCRSFASRLERRRNILITSQRFFRFVSEYLEKTTIIFDKIKMEENFLEFYEAAGKLKDMIENHTEADHLLLNLMKEGEKLMDILSIPVKSALCRDIEIDYTEDITNIRTILNTIDSKKHLFNNAVELNKLSLKQIMLIHLYENDAEQAVKWLNDILDVLIKYHINIGCTVNEIQCQKNELQEFDDTAQSIFDYGCLLLNGARVLRVSCKVNIDYNVKLFTKLHRKWKRLQLIEQEQVTRLRVCAVFHRNIIEHCLRLEELIKTVEDSNQASGVDEKMINCVEKTLENREKLLIDVGRTVRLGRLLKTRLKEPLNNCLSIHDSYENHKLKLESSEIFKQNLSAVEAISEKVDQVTSLAEQLDAILYKLRVSTEISTDEMELSDNSIVKQSGTFSGKNSESEEYLCPIENNTENNQTITEYSSINSAKQETKMVNGYTEIECPGDPEDSNLDRVIIENELTSSKDIEPVSPATTTISTIALQSGDTRLVIALLQSGESLKLKLLELYPELTMLGESIETATNLAAAHDEVLIRLQNKQSPVEELLKQADQLISTQRPRAEIYAAMAETLGQAWKDVNALLELRKNILDHNVIFQCRAEEFRMNVKILKSICLDTELPINIESVEKMINNIHDVRKTMLCTLMNSLQEGRILLEKLRELATEGSLDSRPDVLKSDVEHAIIKVEKWLEEIHEDRINCELSFSSRKNQLEQCLAFSLFAIDLRDIEVAVNDRIAALNSSSDQLGDSASSTEILIVELHKLQLEAKEFQDRSLKIIKSTEKLCSPDYSASNEAIKQAYTVLEMAAQYINSLDQYESLLNKTVKFFNSTQLAFKKLYQLEMEIGKNNHPPYSSEWINVHRQGAMAISDITLNPITEGYDILGITGRGAPGAEAVRRTVEELENRRIQLLERCEIFDDENSTSCQNLKGLIKKCNEFNSWMKLNANVFLRNNKNMGNNLSMADEFYQNHCQLLEDLNKYEDEIQQFSNTITLEIKNDERMSHSKQELEKQVHSLRNCSLELRDMIDARIHLSSLYIEIYETIDALINQFNQIDNEFKKNSEELSENETNKLENEWSKLQLSYSKLKAQVDIFFEKLSHNTDPYLDRDHAKCNIQVALDDFTKKQLTIVETQEKWQKSITTRREYEIKQQTSIEETTRTLEWAFDLEKRLYPILISEATESSIVLHNLETIRSNILPELQQIVPELHDRIDNFCGKTTLKCANQEIMESTMKQLNHMYSHLQTTAENYGILIDLLIKVYKELVQFDDNIKEIVVISNNFESSSSNIFSETGRSDINNKLGMIQEIIILNEDICERTKSAIDEITLEIIKQEPPEAAKYDVEVLEESWKHIYNRWRSTGNEAKSRSQKYRWYCNFASDLDSINTELGELDAQLQGGIKNHNGFIGDDFSTTEFASGAFKQFEDTADALESKIHSFIDRTTENIELTCPQHSASIIRKQLSKLLEKWDQIKQLIEETRKRIDGTIEYFNLLNGAKDWYIKGNKLLIIVAKKSSTARIPDEIQPLLEELDEYFKIREDIQEKRIERIKELSTRIFRTEKLPQFNEVIMGNQETLDSYAVLKSELCALMQNLQDSTEDFEIKLDENMELLKNNVEIQSNNVSEIMHDKPGDVKAQKLTDIRQKYDVVEETVTSAAKSTIHVLLEKEIEEDLDIIEQFKSIVENTHINDRIIEQLPPKFIQELEDSIIDEGERIIFECKFINDVPKCQIMWYKNGKLLVDNPNYLIDVHEMGEMKKCTLTIDSPTVEDTGEFTCNVSNTIGIAASNASLHVKESQFVSPVFIKNLQDISVKKGTSPVIECTVHGNPLPTVQWFRNETIIDHFPEYAITYNNGEAKLKFLEIVTEDQGIYMCKATNVLGQASTSANVVVESDELDKLDGSDCAEKILNQEDKVCYDDEKPMEISELYKAPKMQLLLKDIQVCEGQSVNLDCEIIAQPEPEVIWYHDNQLVKESTDLQLLFEGDRCSLIINEAFENDGGKYKVVAVNGQGQVSSECILSVIPASETNKRVTNVSPPCFITWTSDVSVARGENAHFECKITGEPKPDIIWYFEDEEIIPIDNSVKMLSSQDGLHTLIIYAVTPENTGHYIAKASNCYGQVQAISCLKLDENNELIKPLVAPYFSDVFEKKHLISLGTAGKFECMVQGEPVPEIKWLFNDKPITDGKNCCISVNGDRHILEIPKITDQDIGTITCIAENTAGKAICTTQLEIGEAIEEGEVKKKFEKEVVSHETDMQSSDSCNKYYQTETKNTGPSHQPSEIQETITKMSSSTSKSSITTSSCTKEFKSSKQSSVLDTCHPNSDNVVTKSHTESKQYCQENGGGPPVVQSYKVEEFERIMQNRPDQIEQEKLKIISETTPKIQKQTRKNISPRFVSPVTGMIVNQGSNVVLEGVIDGFPQPTITWSKNGQDVKENIVTKFEHNHVRLELKNVNVKDAGRYTCTAVNECGNASSTADLVVKKTIFPPVFGRRLQAQISKTGERALMEVEITGTPDPTVTWYKDDEPLMDTDGELRQLGNCYLLIIDNVEKRHAGKYMVNASNAGGEAQSIADFAVFEPTPDTMVEVHKTIVYENMADKDLKLDEKKSQLPSAALTAEHISTTMIQPSSTLKTLLPNFSDSTSTSIRKIELITPTDLPTKKQKTIEESVIEKATRSEMFSSTIESHQSETKSEQKFHMKLQHEAPDLIFPTGNQSMPTDKSKITESKGERIDENTKRTDEINENIETSVLGKKEALNFFESMSKGSESTPKGPKAMINLTEDSTDGNYDIKVDKLTKNYERSTKFEEVKEPKFDPQSKKKIQDISNQLKCTTTSQKGIDNVMIDFPYDNYKLPLLNTQRTILEDTTASGSPIHGTLTISKLAAQSESAEKMLSGFNLIPGPPPEMGYIPGKKEDIIDKQTQVVSKAKRLEEFQKKTVDAPIGGIKIFPCTPIYQQQHESDNIAEKSWSSTSDLETRSHISTDLSEYRCQSAASYNQMERSSSPKPSADGLAMEKSWAKKSESCRKSWPSSNQNADFTKKFDKIEENKEEPIVTSKISSHEERHEVDEIPGIGISKTNIESSTMLETRSWNTKESRVEETIIDNKSMRLPEKQPFVKQPIKTPEIPVKMYKAETIKVDHTLNREEKKCKFENYSSQCEMNKTLISNHNKFDELKAPGLVKTAAPPKPAFVQLYHSADNDDNTCNIKCEKIKDFQESSSIFKGTLATAPKCRPCSKLYETSISKTSTGSEMILERGPSPEIGYMAPLSDEFKRSPVSLPKEKFEPYSKSQTWMEEPKYRSVKAPIPKQQQRPRSVESEPPPPSSFKLPPPELTGPPRPFVSSIYTSKNESSNMNIQQPLHCCSVHQDREASLLKPGSPPIYEYSNITPVSTKLKTRNLHKESGYMADTDEPRNNSIINLQNQKKIEKNKYLPMSFNIIESTTKIIEEKSCNSSFDKSHEESLGSSSLFEISHKQTPNEQQKSQSKFVLSEFMRNDRASDHGDCIFSSTTLRNESSGLQQQKADNTMGYKKNATIQKSVLLPGSPPEIAFAPIGQNFISMSDGIPYNNSLGTQINKKIELNERTERSQEFLTVKKTSHFIECGENKIISSKFCVPTPKTFIKGEFRESDYESDVDSTKIRPKWTPRESDTEDPQYRKVEPPRYKSLNDKCFSPVTEFDMSPITINSLENNTTNDQSIIKKYTSRQNESVLSQYSYTSKCNIKEPANSITPRHDISATNTFDETKMEKFPHNMQSDFKQHKSILKHSALNKHLQDSLSDASGAYKTEKQISHYGTKQIDPETGLIYFKYDFGYEFGIVVPSEEKKILATGKSFGKRKKLECTGMEIPILHEFTAENGDKLVNDRKGEIPMNKRSIKEMSQLKTVKWEPNSESEFSEAEEIIEHRNKSRFITSSSLTCPDSPTSLSRWNTNNTPSPMSLNSSIPCFSPISPRHSSIGNQHPSYIDSEPDSSRLINNAASKDIIQPYLDILPKKPPFFTTPLKDIAVMNGQTARFECIVQGEPQPLICWAKNGQAIENSCNFEVSYRNGVCRLVIATAYPDDSGTYVCTATNNLGCSCTSATLEVKDNRRSIHLSY